MSKTEQTDTHPPCAGCSHPHEGHIAWRDGRESCAYVEDCTCVEYLTELPNVARPDCKVPKGDKS